MAKQTTTNDPLRIENAVCAGCGCLCDDIHLTVGENRIVTAEHLCERGRAWFDSPASAGPACTIEGKPARLEEAVDRAAMILTQAKYPLVYGLSDTNSEAQRVAVAIADWVGGNLDTPTSALQNGLGTRLSGVGEVTASLGEIANRADLLLFWRSNPAMSHPRYFERYSLYPQGMFVPEGRKGRTCVVIDTEPTESAAEADLFLKLKPGTDFEALWVLRALAGNVPLDAAAVEISTGIALSAWQTLLERMKQARYGVLLFGSELTAGRQQQLNTEAVWGLMRDMNAFTRFVARPMRGPGNLAGADNVLTWQTGFPFAVNFARGFPRFGPGEYIASELLERGEADAALLVASSWPEHLSSAAQAQLRAIPWISIDSHPEHSRGATVGFTTATYGVFTGGTAYRMDDVPLELRPALKSNLPSDFEVLSAIEVRIKQLQAEAAEATSGRRRP